MADARAGVESALDDDFNTPETLARLFELTRVFNTIARVPGKINPRKAAVGKAYLEFTAWLGRAMGLFGEDPARFLTFLDDMLLKRKNLNRDEIEAIVTDRTAARAAKDFAKSDELRAKLVAMGIAVQDGTDGSEWEVAK